MCRVTVLLRQCAGRDALLQKHGPAMILQMKGNATLFRSYDPSVAVQFRSSWSLIEHFRRSDRLGPDCQTDRSPMRTLLTSPFAELHPRLSSRATCVTHDQSSSVASCWSLLSRQDALPPARWNSLERQPICQPLLPRRWPGRKRPRWRCPPPPHRRSTLHAHRLRRQRCRRCPRPLSHDPRPLLGPR